MSKGQLRLVKFLPALIFALVPTTSIMTGCLIGSNQAVVQCGISGGLWGLVIGCFLGFGGFGLVTAWIWRRKYLNMKLRHSLLLVLGWMFVPVPLIILIFMFVLPFFEMITDGMVLIAICAPPILFALLGALGGFIGGKTSSKVLTEIDPKVPKETHTKIVERSRLGFLAGFFVGGIPMNAGLFGSVYEPYLWAHYVAIGFALIGIIGATIASSALFSIE